MKQLQIEQKVKQLSRLPPLNWSLQIQSLLPLLLEFLLVIGETKFGLFFCFFILFSLFSLSLTALKKFE